MYGVTQISPQVVIQLPKVDAYVVQGQDLEALAKTFSNVTAKSLGKAQNPPAEPNAIYAIGKTLVLPEDAWGSAPPNTINNGTACVQNAVPQSVFETISGTPSAGNGSATPPAQTSSQVTIASWKTWRERGKVCITDRRSRSNLTKGFSKKAT